MRTTTVQFDVYKFDELKQESCKDSAIVFVMQDREFETEEEVTPEVLDDYEFYWDGQIYQFAHGEVKPSMKEKQLFLKAILTTLAEWGGDTPHEASTAVGEFLDWFEAEYNVKLNIEPDELGVYSYEEIEKKILEL